MSQLIADFGTGQVLWSVIWFTLFFIWIYILIIVFGDIFRSDDLGGGGKTLWVIFVILLPYLGVFVYLIARGSKMQERAMKEAAQRAEMQRQYIQQVAGSSSGGGAADEIARLADLKAKGAITDAEYEAAKAKVLGG